MSEKKRSEVADVDRSLYDFTKSEEGYERYDDGLTPEIVRAISEKKEEPEWMLQMRLSALETYHQRQMATNWGPSIAGLDLNHISTYVSPKTQQANSWDDVPEDIRDTFDRLGIPQAEAESLAGVGAQYDSEIVYHNMREEVAEQGVIYTTIEDALHDPQWEPVVKEYFGKLIPPSDHKFAALHYAVWSGMYNLNTKRAIIGSNAKMEWVSGSFGSHVSYLYPSTIMNGDSSNCEFTGITFAGATQDLDTGCKVIINGSNNSANVDTKSISKDGGVNTFRSAVTVGRKAENARVAFSCQSLMLDNISRSDTIPEMDVRNATAQIGHEATIGRISDDTVLYLMSRGCSEAEARTMVVNGFANPVSKELPMEYAVEMNNLIKLEMEGAIG